MAFCPIRLDAPAVFVFYNFAPIFIFKSAFKITGFTNWFCHLSFIVLILSLFCPTEQDYLFVAVLEYPDVKIPLIKNLGIAPIGLDYLIDLTLEEVVC